MEHTIKCPICGKLFESNKPRARYCSDDCRTAGYYVTRKKWESRSDYNRKQRDALRERRAIQREIQTGITREQQNEKKSIRAQEQIEYKAKRDKEFGDRVNNGEPLANMWNALCNGGKLNTEYWYWFKQNEIDCSTNESSKTVVNGYSIYEPDFEQLVIASINDLGTIFISKCSEGNIWNGIQT